MNGESERLRLTAPPHAQWKCNLWGMPPVTRQRCRRLQRAHFGHGHWGVRQEGLIEISKFIEMIRLGVMVRGESDLRKFQEQTRGETKTLILKDGGKARGERQHLQPRQLRQRPAGSCRVTPETKTGIRSSMSSTRRIGGLQATSQPTVNQTLDGLGLVNKLRHGAHSPHGLRRNGGQLHHGVHSPHGLRRSGGRQPRLGGHSPRGLRRTGGQYQKQRCPRHRKLTRRGDLFQSGEPNATKRIGSPSSAR